MQRILLIGCGGAGKSTLAAALGPRLGLPVIHLDREFWQPGWVEPSDVEWDAAVARLAAEPRWVMDGNYSRTLAVRLEACDAVVFLDFPRWRCLFRVLWRGLKYLGKARPDMNPECPERFPPDAVFLRWIWTYRKRNRSFILAALDRVKERKRVSILRTPKEVRRFLENPA